jgi:hypothetical protein
MVIILFTTTTMIRDRDHHDHHHHHHHHHIIIIIIITIVTTTTHRQILWSKGALVGDGEVGEQHGHTGTGIGLREFLDRQRLAIHTRHLHDTGSRGDESSGVNYVNLQRLVMMV